mmetsp:Transcript_11438/g.34961  ORF Transcript_11438/g.34961 Transcript_11438/m.34961 type:complete len:179 (-) Transcript_11438:235-771(-)
MPLRVPNRSLQTVELKKRGRRKLTETRIHAVLMRVRATVRNSVPKYTVPRRRIERRIHGTRGRSRQKKPSADESSTTGADSIEHKNCESNNVSSAAAVPAQRGANTSQNYGGDTSAQPLAADTGENSSNSATDEMKKRSFKSKTRGSGLRVGRGRGQGRGVTVRSMYVPKNPTAEQSA